MADFRQGLADQGLVIGENVAIDFEFPIRLAQLSAHAARLVCCIRQRAGRAGRRRSPRRRCRSRPIPNGGLADSLDATKAAFRAVWGARLLIDVFADFGACGRIPPSNGNSTVPAIETHCSLGTATMRPSVFRQLPDPS
jgi:hypothetical protein